MKGGLILNKGGEVSVEDWKLIKEDYVLGTRRRIWVNSQGHLRHEGYTRGELNSFVLDACKAYRERDPSSSDDFRHTMSVPNHIIDQMWIENGADPLSDPDMMRDLLLNNPDLAAFRTNRPKLMIPGVGSGPRRK